ncbi:YlbE-like family protein [Metabacillus arenae]|uniref:YlbE-like family protein n=1 Tax=Metabacillus arenae TaxID=2771434 RepID=A0A926RXR5_9BACI|nr:YlbE-like family protein [Metabacillus arenae]MBD1380960.1 YlbE-like family protein [Metabacillus arenae]
MRKEVIDFIEADKDLKKFIRENPYWYRKLSRNPKDTKSFQVSMMNQYQKTIPHKVAQFSNSIQMANMMVGMFHAMKHQD